MISMFCLGPAWTETLVSRAPKVNFLWTQLMRVAFTCLSFLHVCVAPGEVTLDDASLQISLSNGEWTWPWCGVKKLRDSTSETVKRDHILLSDPLEAE